MEEQDKAKVNWKRWQDQGNTEEKEHFSFFTYGVFIMVAITLIFAVIDKITGSGIGSGTNYLVHVNIYISAGYLIAVMIKHGLVYSFETEADEITKSRRIAVWAGIISTSWFMVCLTMIQNSGWEKAIIENGTVPALALIGWWTYKWLEKQYSYGRLAIYGLICFTVASIMRYKLFPFVHPDMGMLNKELLTTFSFAFFAGGMAHVTEYRDKFPIGKIFLLIGIALSIDAIMLSIFSGNAVAMKDSFTCIVGVLGGYSIIRVLREWIEAKKAEKTKETPDTKADKEDK